MKLHRRRTEDGRKNFDGDGKKRREKGDAVAASRDQIAISPRLKFKVTGTSLEKKWKGVNQRRSVPIVKENEGKMEGDREGERRLAETKGRRFEGRGDSRRSATPKRKGT